jgi:hypothetical protein
MALKKMRISFDIDIPVLLSMLAAGNSAMKIDVYGDERPAKMPRAAKVTGQGGQNGHQPKLLEGPKPRAGRIGKISGYAAMLAHFVAHKDRGYRAIELRPVLVEIGLNEKSVSPQLTKLKVEGLVKKERDGLYHVTPRGIAYHEKTTAAAAAQQQAAE